MRTLVVGLALGALVAATGLPARAQPKPPYPATVANRQAFELLARKDFSGALLAANQALAESPNDLVALAARGEAYSGLGDFPRAMADHDAVLKTVPNDVGALINACWVRALANVELDRALTYCDAATKDAAAFRRAGAAYDTRGFLHYRRGEFTLAVADYDAALKEIPRYAGSRYGRGLAKLRLGKTAEGQADLAAALKLDAGIAETFAKRGVVP
jgi:tetratricopeptide (TPR) repeat protein